MKQTPAEQDNTQDCRPHGEMAGDCRGLNFYDIDPALERLLGIYVGADLLHEVRGSLRHLGELAGTRLDELAFVADAHPPRLHARDRHGQDEDWIEYHGAYRELEHYAYCVFGIHAIGRRPGLLGSSERLPALLKYVCQYLFVQSEFGLVCPVAMTDSCAHVVQTHGDPEVRNLFLQGLTSNDPATLLKGAQMMTERQAGSDVGMIRTAAQRGAKGWEISGEKWFCSAADADIIMVLARSTPGSAGTDGLSLFAVPRTLPEGGRNSYVIKRLKTKLGTRSMPTGEIEFSGARGYLVGQEGHGLRIILEQVNMSRLSHGVRAAGMMRRCLNEAMVAARTRRQFGGLLVELPVVRMQLLQMKLAAEQALSMSFATAAALEAVAGGDGNQQKVLRILTPLIKLGACRDNVAVATASMEVRGGNGFISDYINERLVRDAQTGLLWEGTSNIIAHDLTMRAMAKERAHIQLLQSLSEELHIAASNFPSLRIFDAIWQKLSSAASQLEELSAAAVPIGGIELGMSLYHAASAAVMACEGAKILRNEGNGQRLLLSHLVMTLRLRTGACLTYPAMAVAAALDDKAVALKDLEEMGLA
jgi:alkylation response protein AidB-like acyl-CoA dehydrogenase